MKRILAILLALALLLSCGAALAEDPSWLYDDEDEEDLSFEWPEFDIPDEITDYVEGPVARFSLFDFGFFAQLDELEVAYLDCDSNWLVKGKTTTWTVNATGGYGDYEYEFHIYYRSDITGGLYRRYDQERSSNPQFTYTVEFATGQYMVNVIVYDEMGHSLKWNSPLYVAAKAGDENNSSTVPGKVTMLAKQCIAEAGSSDFARALWLHDWLTTHADYDQTYTYFYPEGVLLYGKGVCQSYSLAYGMLLKAVGIDNIYITGEAGGGAHSWNLVKLGGKWYHVDCTWDDPIGLSPVHDYFALTDAQMAVDHTWSRADGVLPVCDSTDMSFSDMVYAPNVGSTEEAMTLLRNAMQNYDYWLYLVFPDRDMATTFSHQAQQFLASYISHGWLSGATCERAWQLYPDERTDGILCFEQYVSEAEARRCFLLFDYGYGYGYPQTALYVHFISQEALVAPREQLKLSLFVDPQDCDGVEWASSDPAIASVQNGIVIGRTPGMAVITASLPSGQSTECRVFVVTSEDLFLSGTVVEIEEEAFADIKAFATLIIDEGVTIIGPRAFAGCECLLHAYLPASLTDIADDAFADCENITLICPEGSVAAAYAERLGLPFEFAE